MNVPPWTSSGCSVLLRGAARHIASPRHQAEKVQLVRITHDRHDEAVLGIHGNTHVDLRVDFEVACGQGGVQRRVLGQRQH